MEANKRRAESSHHFLVHVLDLSFDLGLLGLLLLLAGLGDDSGRDEGGAVVGNLLPLAGLLAIVVTATGAAPRCALGLDLLGRFGAELGEGFSHFGHSGLGVRSRVSGSGAGSFVVGNLLGSR